jgi:hypothetical protein
MLSPISGTIYTNNKAFLLTVDMEASPPEGMESIDYYIHTTKARTASQTEDAQILLKEQHSFATNKETQSIIQK